MGSCKSPKKAFFSKVKWIKFKKKILSIEIDKVEITLSQQLRHGFVDYQSTTLIGSIMANICI
jgi:hypothetical protein